MHIALYRKYRSRDFDDVKGQEHITSVLKYQAANNRVSHAYLFCGSRGTGKTSCAKILAKSVNCENPVNGNPCGECASCKLIDSGNATDVMEMDAASDTGVDYIRSIKEEVQYPPMMLKKRVYIIDEVHMLTVSAFNALLKTLEEPPAHVVFILATTEVHKLLPTVISRCQRFDFRRIAADVIADRLAYIAGKESIPLEAEAAQIIAKQARGGMRDAISMFELCSGGGADVTVPRVLDILGVSGYEAVHRASLAIADRNVKALFEIIAEVAASSKDISVFWQELTSFYRDMLIAKYSEDAKKYLDLTDGECTLLFEAADRFTLASLFYQSRVLDEALKDMNRMPETKRATAEFALVRLCEPALTTTVDALNARITELENKIGILSGGGVIQPASPVNNSDSDKAAAEENTLPFPANDTQTSSSDTHIPEKAEAAGNGSAAESEKADEKNLSDSLSDKDEKAVGDEAKEAVPKKFILHDLSEVAGKMNDRLASVILSDANAEINADGSRIKIITGNPMATVALTGEALKKLADAFVACRITDKIPRIDIVVSSEVKKSKADELEGF